MDHVKKNQIERKLAYLYIQARIDLELNQEG